MRGGFKTAIAGPVRVSMIDLEASRERLETLHGRVRERHRLVDLLTGRETADVSTAEKEFSTFDEE